MATIPMFDPLSTEVRSPLIAGLTEACNKLSTVLDLGISECVDLPLNPVVGKSGKVFIYQAPLGTKLWLSSPKPVIKKNGEEITEDVDGFTINYIGGSIEFDTGRQPSIEFDTLTVSTKYVVGNSNVIEDLVEKQNSLTDSVNSFKGNFPDLETLEEEYPEGEGGDYAIVSSPSGVMMYLWNVRTNQWEPSSTETDLSDYYNKTETDTLLSAKENTITPPTPIEGSTVEDYYYNGAKQWAKFEDKVKDVPLTGLDTSVSGEITPDDTLAEALGKLQNQIDDSIPDIKGTGAPTDALEGLIGQEYTNTSTGDKYHLVEITPEGKYIWKQYQDKDFDTEPTEGSSNLITSGDLYTKFSSVSTDLDGKADKVVGATAGHIVTLDADGNIVDSGKAFTDLGSNAKQATVTLSTSGWSGTSPATKTVTVSDVVADSTKQNISVAPYPSTSNIDAISSYSIYCSGQGDNTLTFTSIKGVPTIETQFNVSIQNL